jgi:hypothetical protein
MTQLTALTEKILNENPELGNKWTSLIPQGKMGRPVSFFVRRSSETDH